MREIGQVTVQAVETFLPVLSTTIRSTDDAKMLASTFVGCTKTYSADFAISPTIANPAKLAGCPFGVGVRDGGRQIGCFSNEDKQEAPRKLSGC